MGNLGDPSIPHCRSLQWLININGELQVLGLTLNQDSTLCDYHYVAMATADTNKVQEGFVNCI